MRRSHCNTLPGLSRILPSQPSIPSFIATALVAPRATLPTGAAKRQMAEDMRQASQREGGISRDDLQLLGWTPLQIDTLAPAARQLAQSMSGMSI
jgi:hypothetical protein